MVREEAAGGRAALAVSRVVGGAGKARLAREEAEDDKEQRMDMNECLRLMCDLGSVNRTLFYTKTGRTHVVKASEGGQENEHGERDDSVPLRGGESARCSGASLLVRFLLLTQALRGSRRAARASGPREKAKAATVALSYRVGAARRRKLSRQGRIDRRALWA